MKNKTKLDIAYFMIIVSIIFRIIETWYFGWNSVPINEYELLCDRISECVMTIGIVFFIMPLFDIYHSKALSLDKYKKN